MASQLQHIAATRPRKSGNRVAVGPASVPVDSFTAPPLLDLHPQRSDAKRIASGPVGGASKRLLDMMVAGTALLLLSPLLAFVWVAVRVESKGPGLFRQRRGGYRGQPFFIYKFRTMTICEDVSITQAVAGDQRVTRLGAFLRKTSIDELPQLFNVLKGDMSLVGPRPHALAHDKHFASVAPRYSKRFRARPGITGLAQVSGSRGPTETDDKIKERAEFDASYVRHWSWWMDAQILVKTCRVVFNDPNAL